MPNFCDSQQGWNDIFQSIPSLESVAIDSCHTTTGDSASTGLFLYLHRIVNEPNTRLTTDRAASIGVLGLGRDDPRRPQAHRRVGGRSRWSWITMFARRRVPDLTNPRTRLEGAEIAWLPGVSPRKAVQLVENLLNEPMAIREESGPADARPPPTCWPPRSGAVDSKANDVNDLVEFIVDTGLHFRDADARRGSARHQ